MSSYQQAIPENPLRPQQVLDLKDEKKRLETFIKRDDVDRKDARINLRKVNEMIVEQSAKQLTGQDLDSATKRIDTLEAEIKKGMLSDEEMRKSPPGAVGKHMAHEKAQKGNIQEWKKLQCAVHAGDTNPDLANIERLRPKKSSMNMHNALVSGTEHHNIDNAASATVLTSSDIKLITERAPEEVYTRLCTMDAEQRAIAKQQYVTDYKAPKAPLSRKN